MKTVDILTMGIMAPRVLPDQTFFYSILVTPGTGTG
jgi:hypothetical protein